MNVDPHAYLNKLSTSDLIQLYDNTPSMPLKSTIACKITARQWQGKLRKEKAE